jgi:trigger factor
MEFRVEALAPCRKKVTITVPPEAVRKEIDGQYAEVNKQISLPGFRPGKAPRRILEARFGRHVAQEAKQKVVEAAFRRLVEEKRVDPLQQPEVDVNDVELDPAKAFEFSFEVTTKPEFELPAWKGREVKAPPVVVADAEIAKAVEQVLLMEGTLVTADGAIGEGSVAVVDWVATDGEAKLHEEASSYHRLGTDVLDGILVEGFDAKLVGAKAGDVILQEGKAAPDDPRPALAGKTFPLRVTVQEVKRFQPAALDEAYLKRHDFDDEAEFRADVAKRVRRAKERERDRLVEDRLVDGLLAGLSMELPAAIVDASIAEWTERRRVEALSEGRAEDDVTKELASGAGDIRSKVEADLRRHFVLERICEAEGIAVTEQELMGALEQIARDNRRTPAEVLEHFREQPARLGELRAHLRHEKARAELRKAAAVIDEAAPPPGKSK